MGITNITDNSFNAVIFGKEYTIRYQVRNFIALKKRFNLEMHELVNNVLQGDLEAIVQMIWCGTLVFNDFDPANPTSIKEEIELQRLYEMDGGELRELGLEITKGLLDSLPKTDNAKKKTKTTSMVAKALRKIKTLLQMK